MTAPPAHLDEQRTRLTRRAIRLAQITIAYNIVEAVVAVTAGVTAGLLSLTGFGLDAAVESASAVVVTAHLSARLRRGTRHPERERTAVRAVAVTFYLLAGYLTVKAAIDLTAGHTPQSSPAGIAILITSLIVMPVLTAAKYRTGHALADPLVLADAAESRLCVLLSATTLIAVLATTATGLTWIDPAAGLLIAAAAIREGREAWHGGHREPDDTA